MLMPWVFISDFLKYSVLLLLSLLLIFHIRNLKSKVFFDFHIWLFNDIIIILFIFIHRLDNQDGRDRLLQIWRVFSAM